MLPLHICSLMVWISGIILVIRSHRIYEFSHFLGIGAGLQALATPDLGIYGFPHFRYFQTLLSHRLIITAAVYMLAIYFVNDSIGSSYLMVNAKPDVPSLLDYLPNWPWYILWMEAIGVISFLLLYSSFISKDWKTRTHTNTWRNPCLEKNVFTRGTGRIGKQNL